MQLFIHKSTEKGTLLSVKYPDLNLTYGCFYLFIYLLVGGGGQVILCFLKRNQQWKNTKVVLWKMLQCINSTAESRTQALLCYHTADPTIYYRSILSTEMEKKNSSTRMLLRKTTQFTCVCLKAKASYLCTNHSSVVSNSNTFSSDFLLCVITGFLLMLPKKPLPWFSTRKGYTVYILEEKKSYTRYIISIKLTESEQIYVFFVLAIMGFILFVIDCMGHFFYCIIFSIAKITFISLRPNLHTSTEEKYSTNNDHFLLCNHYSVTLAKELILAQVYKTN